MISWPSGVHNAFASQLSWGPRWLSGIGSHFHLLSSVLIDVDTICNSECYLFYDSDEMELELLPLARLMWAKPNCRILFARTSSNWNRNLHNFIPMFAPDPPIDTGILNNTMQTITKGDFIRRYGRFERLVSSVMIKRDLTEGRITFSSTEKSRDTDLFFHVQSKGREFRFFERQPHVASRLLNLPHSALRKICDYSIYSPTGIHFDLDLKVVKGLDKGFLWLNRSMRQTVQQRVSSSIKVTAQMTTAELCTTFSGYQALRQWLCDDKWDSLLATKAGSVLGGPMLPSAIVLRFNLSTTTPLRDLRVGMKDFICLTYNLYEKTLIRFSLTYPSAGGHDLIEHTIPLREMRRSCFILCSEVLSTWSQRRNTCCTEVFVNGYGIAIQAICPTNGELHLGKYNTSNTEDDWQKLAYEHYEKSVKPPKDQLEGMFGDMTPFVDSRSIYDMYRTLRNVVDAAYYSPGVS